MIRPLMSTLSYVQRFYKKEKISKIFQNSSTGMGGKFRNIDQWEIEIVINSLSFQVKEHFDSLPDLTELPVSALPPLPTLGELFKSGKNDDADNSETVGKPGG